MKTFNFWCDGKGCVFHGRLQAADAEEARNAPETVHVGCDHPQIVVREVEVDDD